MCFVYDVPILQRKNFVDQDDRTRIISGNKVKDCRGRWGGLGRVSNSRRSVRASTGAVILILKTACCAAPF